jgi:hypothetical protein
LQWKAYLIFMITNLLFVPLVYFCYPETANLTLEEMDLLFTNKEKSAVKFSKELSKRRRIEAKTDRASSTRGTDVEKGGSDRTLEHVEHSTVSAEK